MPFVVDASVAVCWFMPDERHPIADAAFRRIRLDPAVASVLWWYELRNVLIVNERRGRLDNAKTARVLRLLRGLAGRDRRRCRGRGPDATGPAAPAHGV